MATCQPHNPLCNRFLFVTSLAGLFAHYAFTPSPVLFQIYASSFDPSPLFLQRESTVSPPGQLEYYVVVWGLTKVLQNEVLAAVSRLRRRYGGSAQFERQRGMKTVLWPHALSVHELHKKKTFIF